MKTLKIVLSILLKGAPTNEDFAETVANVPALAEMAAQMLLERQPTNEELMGIIMCSRENNWLAAWQKLLTQNPSNGQLVEVSRKIKKLRREAWEQLLKQFPTNAELVAIIKMRNELLIPAWKQLLTQSPTDAEVYEVYGDQCQSRWVKFSHLEWGKPAGEDRFGELRVVAAATLLSLKCSNEILCNLIYESGVSLLAARTLLEQSPTNEQLYKLLEWIKSEEIQERAAVMLMEREHNPRLLMNVICSSKAQRSEAAKILWSMTGQAKEDIHLWVYSTLMAWVPELSRQAWKKYWASNPSTNDAQHAYLRLARCSASRLDSRACGSGNSERP